MNFFVPNLGARDPILRMVVEKVCEVVLQIWVIHYPLNEAIVVFLSGSQQLQFTIQQLSIFFVFHQLQVIQKSFYKILGQVFSNASLSLTFSLRVKWFLKYVNSLMQANFARLLGLGKKAISIPDGDDFIVKLDGGDFLHELPILLAQFVADFDLIGLDASLGNLLDGNHVVIFAVALASQQVQVVAIWVVGLLVGLPAVLPHCIEDHELQ